MVQNVLEIKDTLVREVMTPLVDVVAFSSEGSEIYSIEVNGFVY